jgi:FKBP-type peptidyl-prolyl cis-trans isomerase SlyD
MTEKGIPTKVENDVVVSMDYTLTVEGKEYDSSKESGVIEFIQGHEHIIPGLEKEVYGMKVGERKKIRILPADGYGEIDPDMIIEIAKSEFPSEMTLLPGLEIEMEDDEGEIVDALVVSVGDEKVKLDFNEPLAGKELEFEVKIVDLRFPSQGELECGHVHCDEECFELDCSNEEDCL